MSVLAISGRDVQKAENATMNMIWQLCNFVIFRMWGDAAEMASSP